LDQVRLCVASNDWLTAENNSRKISTRWFDSADTEDSIADESSPHLTKLSLKLRYYDLMIRLSLHQSDYLSTAKHYQSVYLTPAIQEISDRARAVLQNVLIFVVLAPYDNEQADLLARVVREDPVKNDQMGWVGSFVKRFTDGELMRWPMVQQIYGNELRQTDIFAVDKGDGKGQERWEALAKRVTEHVLSKKTWLT
jgi:26S proteasome regulatory subunit N5